MTPIVETNELSTCQSEEFNTERRASTRYRVALPVRYTIERKRRPEVHEGHTIDLSSCGLKFSGNNSLRIGQEIKAAIDWPTRLDGNVHLQLILVGCVVRTDLTATALKMHKYEFRTRRVT